MQENSPALWKDHFPWPAPEKHKYDRGSVLVAGGGMASSGAARLAAMAALRVCGVSTVACPASALPVYAASLLAVMVRPYRGTAAFAQIAGEKKYHALALGPGQGVGEETARQVLAALATRKPAVLDADALTSFEHQPEVLFQAISGPVIMTPHAGEFARLFGKEADRGRAVSQAAECSGAVVVLKGHDTLIAAPDGRLVINRAASPWLATAGSGDVLTGLCVALLAGGVEHFHAACMAVWLHVEAAQHHGPGLTAEALVQALPVVIASKI